MDAQLGRQRVTVSPNAEACRNMADLGWKCLCLIGPTCCQEDRGNVVQRAQPAAGIMEESVQSLKEGAGRSQAG